MGGVCISWVVYDRWMDGWRVGWKFEVGRGLEHEMEMLYYMHWAELK